jgi:hypothetical protein
MKSSPIILSTACLLTLLLNSCGPAAEDRNAMHQRAKIFQDSIAQAIRMQLAESDGPAALQYTLENSKANDGSNNK